MSMKSVGTVTHAHHARTARKESETTINEMSNCLTTYWFQLCSKPCLLSKRKLSTPAVH